MTEHTCDESWQTLMSDDALYRQYLAGDLSAGDALMLKWGDALTAYLAAILHNYQDAEDMMLGCFAVLLVKKPKIAEGRFRAYLLKMARNKATRLHWLRLRRNEFSLDETLLSQGDTPEEVLGRSEQSVALYKCMNRVAPQYREALWLVYGLGLSYAQAAEVMGGNVKRVEDLLRNGKKALRKELDKEGIDDANI